jgi:small subunit ribosomal protein S20
LANIKSQIKRNKQNEKRRLRNRTMRGAARTAVKNANKAMTSGEETQASLLVALSTLDKAAEKGVLHPKNAARRKSRLMKAANKIAAAPAPVVEEKKKKAPAKKVSTKAKKADTK